MSPEKLMYETVPFSEKVQRVIGKLYIKFGAFVSRQYYTQFQKDMILIIYDKRKIHPYDLDIEKAEAELVKSLKEN